MAARDQERRIVDAAGFGLTASGMILQNQILLLRFWADNIEKFAQFCESGTEKLKSGVEQELHRERAA